MEKKYKWGILAPGNIAHKMAEALQILPNAELYAVASRRLETAQKFAATYSMPKAYGSYKELANDKDVEIIYIATPHPFHFENTMMCLEAGKAVLCEKAFGMNTLEVKTMIEKAREKNVFLMEALWTRFLPHINEIKKLIDNNAIGKIRFLKSDFGIKVPYTLEHRCISKELGGGSLLDVGIYTVFLALFLLGKPKTIVAKAGIGETGVDLNCSMTFGYNNDTLAVLYSSVVAKTQVTSQIYGENGTIDIDEWWFTPVGFRLKTNETDQYRNPPTTGNGYNYEAAHVMQCLNEKRIESQIWTWQNSIDLMETLDKIGEMNNE